MSQPEPALVDSHCHLPLLEAAAQAGVLDDVLATASNLGVEHMLCVSVDLPSFPDVLALATKHAHVFASVGVHPNTEESSATTVATLVEHAAHPRVVAIGETGLDYYRSSGDLEWQRDRFRTHIRAARESAKPLIIHTREAATDVIRVLREEAAAEVGGVMHCFVDDWQTAEKAMEMNFYVSFSGIVTFKNATQVQEVARQVPLERLLIETDSPYLAPVPYRGRPNQPGYVRHVAEFIADLRGIELNTLANATTENFFTLFATAKR